MSGEDRRFFGAFFCRDFSSLGQRSGFRLELRVEANNKG